MEKLSVGASKARWVSFALAAIMGSSGCCSAVFGQESPAQKPKFEAASVRRSAPGTDRYAVRVSPATMIYTGVTLRLLIRTAWRIQDLQIVGGPSWLDTVRFDISAKLDKPHPPVEMLAMIQDLLEDRFRLVVVPDRRVQSHFSLVQSPSNAGKHPGLIKATEDECVPQTNYESRPSKPDAAPPCGGVRTRSEGNLYQMAATSIPLSQFAMILTGVTGSWVENVTGIEGNYDVRLSWPIPVEANPPTEGMAPDSTFIAKALETQLGLKLEPVKGPIPVFVIQRAEMPTEN